MYYEYLRGGRTEGGVVNMAGQQKQLSATLQVYIGIVRDANFTKQRRPAKLESVPLQWGKQLELKVRMDADWVSPETRQCLGSDKLRPMRWRTT